MIPEALLVGYVVLVVLTAGILMARWVTSRRHGVSLRPRTTFDEIACWLVQGGTAGWIAIVVLGLSIDLLDMPHVAVRPIDVVALATTILAAASLLTVRPARALAMLYALGLTAIGLGLQAMNFSPWMLCWGSINNPAGHVLAASVIGWILVQRRRRNGELSDVQATDGWFHRTQAVTIAVTALMSAWVSMDTSFDGKGKDLALFGLCGRLSGPPAELMLVGAAIMMAASIAGPYRARWQSAAIVLGFLLNCCIGWSMLNARSPALWLHRAVGMLLAAVMLTVLSRFGIAKIVPHGSDWIDRGRESSVPLARLAVVALVIVLALAAADFAATGQTHLVPWEILLVAGSLLAVTGMSLRRLLLSLT